MKNIIKNILSVAVLSTVTMASALTVHAQNMTEPYKDVNGICFKKSASLNPDGHSYTVTLESFVKGEVKIVQGVKPADIVLVLDVSGSMKDLFGTDYVELEHPDSNDGYIFSNLHFNTDANGNPRFDTAPDYPFIFYNGAYRQLKRSYKTVNGTKYYCLWFLIGSNRYFLKINGTIERSSKSSSSSGLYDIEATSYGVTTENILIWPANASVPLSRRANKLDGLKVATKKFVDVVASNDTDNGSHPSYGHQIAITIFGSSAENIIGFTPVTQSGVNTLKEKIDGLTIPNVSHTRTDLGVELAKNALTTLLSTTGHGKEETSKFVVVFTDGNPTDDEGLESFSGTDGTASKAIGHAKIIKNTEGDDAINGKVFSIGMVPSSEASTNTNIFLNYLSSNFPNAENMDTPGSGGEMNKPDGYYKDASSGDLSGIFEAIAEQATGGAENTTVTSESSVTVDVVSSSFNIPSGAGSNVTLKFAKCNGEDANGYLTFDDANAITITSTTTAAQLESAGMVLSENDDIPEVDLDQENNKVSVANYEYSANWCGLNESLTPAAYRGFKQILSFRIEIDEGAVGGPATATNEANSGIYVNGQPIAVFNQPQVVMPVSIWIQKQGLEGSDSAVFTLKRSEKTYEEYRAMGLVDANGYLNPKDSRITYLNFTKVVVNDNTMDADGVVKITGLDARYIYTIKEDAWAEAAYDFENGTQYTLKVNKTDKEPSNPFIFINTPNASHANAKVGEDNSHNVFNVK